MFRTIRIACLFLVFAAAFASASAQTKRKVIIDQDARGPGSTDQQAILLLIQSQQTEVLGITIVSGDQWRDEEVAHTLRMLEIVGRTDIPVVPGAIFPLVNSREEEARWEALYGKVVYKGAWNPGYRPDPYAIPPMPEGNPTTKPSSEDAAHFLIRMVHKYPHEVTIYAGGPLTNLAIATSIDPEFPKLARELVFMGPIINPGTADPEFYQAPRRGFNCWWDPEATRIVFRAPWPKITVTTIDISIKTNLSKTMLDELAKTQSPVAQYVTKYSQGGYMWDELAAEAWLDPSIIAKEQFLYMDISLGRGPSYGDTLVWPAGSQPGLGEQQVHILEEVNTEKLDRMFLDLMSAPTPGANPK